MKSAEYQLEQKRLEAILEMENCGKNYTPEQVGKWKDLGLTQPEWIKDKDWAMGGELTPSQAFICRSAALLMSHDEISDMTGFSSTHISAVVNSNSGKAEIDRVHDKFFNNTKKMLDDILPLAIKTAFKVMLDPKTKPQTRADAAFRFMDRVMGRPVQQVEINDNLIRQVYEKLDANNVIDIAAKRIENAVLVADQSKEEPDTSNLDSVDSWVKENL